MYYYFFQFLYFWLLGNTQNLSVIRPSNTYCKSEVNEIIQRAHVFCLPSVRESGGAVLLEAMAVGRPVIAIDFGGPAEIVDEGVGVKLPATGKADVVQGLISALENVRQQPELWIARGQEGRRRVEHYYSWDAKIASAIAFYRELLELKS